MDELKSVIQKLLFWLETIDAVRERKRFVRARFRRIEQSPNTGLVSISAIKVRQNAVGMTGVYKLEGKTQFSVWLFQNEQNAKCFFFAKIFVFVENKRQTTN